MKITIVRHGKPAAVVTGWITSAEMAEWIRSYNASPLSADSNPPAELKAIAQNGGGIVCSNLRRSIESAELLDAGKVISKSDLFAEAGLPYAGTGYIKLPVNLWAALFRVCWLFGYSNNSESHAQARLRAKNAATELNNLADLYTDIIYVGHGIFNRMLVKELLRNGWLGPKYPSGTYWGHAEYVSSGG